MDGEIVRKVRGSNELSINLSIRDVTRSRLASFRLIK